MAEYVEIDIDQGTDFSLNLGLKEDDGTPKNVTGYTFSSYIKKSFYSTSAVAEFSVDYADSSNGDVILYLTSTQTTDIKPGRYLFDIKQKSANNVVERIAEGIVTVNPQVTD